ncbi:MAG: hypothetical protein AAGF94_15770 [Pseudomonadota bacterium]
MVDSLLQSDSTFGKNPRKADYHMSRRTLWVPAAIFLTFAAPAFAGNVSEDAINGCIDELRALGFPDSQGGTVVSTEHSEANSLVVLQDLGNSVWRCLVSNEGIVAELSVAQAADDGGGAMAGSEQDTTPPQDVIARVELVPGATGTEFKDSLLPQEIRRYVLSVRDGQFLYFRLAANGPGMTCVIYNPDGSVLLDEMGAAQEYRGQLWQTGDHVIELYNTANGAQSYNVVFGTE